jgi:MFS family permease
MFAMVFFGVGEVLGCFFVGYFIDKYGSRFAVFINVGIIIIMSVVTLWFISLFEYNFLAFLMCFMWGFQDSALHTHTQEILGFEFDDNFTPFSLFGIWQSLCCFVFQLIVSEVETPE